MNKSGTCLYSSNKQWKLYNPSIMVSESLESLTGCERGQCNSRDAVASIIISENNEYLLTAWQGVLEHCSSRADRVKELWLFDLFSGWLVLEVSMRLAQLLMACLAGNETDSLLILFLKENL